MIKKYKQFISGKTNEEFVMSPAPLPGETEIQTPVKTPLEEPAPPALIPTETEEPAPAKAEIEGGDIYEENLKMLVDKLEERGITAEKIEKEVFVKKQDNTKLKVTFPSENNMFHIDGKKQPKKTVDQIVDQIYSMVNKDATEPLEVSDKQAVEDFQQNESRSYRTTRKFRKSK